MANKTVSITLNCVWNFHLHWLFSLSLKRYLTEKVVPGNRVTVMGIYSIKKVAQKNDKVRCSKSKDRNEVGSYLLTVPSSVKKLPGLEISWLFCPKLPADHHSFLVRTVTVWVLVSGSHTSAWLAFRLIQKVLAEALEHRWILLKRKSSTDSQADLTLLRQ